MGRCSRPGLLQLILQAMFLSPIKMIAFRSLIQVVFSNLNSLREAAALDQSLPLPASQLIEQRVMFT